MFKTNPGLVPVIGKPDYYCLDGPLVYVARDCTITAPTGFITDLASVPNFLDWIPFLDRAGLSRRPGVIHDAIYNLGRIKGKDYADAMLAEMCRSEGMNQFQAGCYYRGVHLFGDKAWATDKCMNIEGFRIPDNFITVDAYNTWQAAGGTIYS